ncbi:unnamed protein product [Rotaria sordida]|nr:unnamed protein product [Rotaria sordida]
MLSYDVYELKLTVIIIASSNFTSSSSVRVTIALLQIVIDNEQVQFLSKLINVYQMGVAQLILIMMESKIIHVKFGQMIFQNNR